MNRARSLTEDVIRFLNQASDYHGGRGKTLHFEIEN